MFSGLSMGFAMVTYGSYIFGDVCAWLQLDPRKTHGSARFVTAGSFEDG